MMAGYADLAGLTLRANGGEGGVGNSTANDSGGGGGGGEIELHAALRLGAPTLAEALGGLGGPNGTGGPGQNGGVGVVFSNASSTLPTGVVTSVGVETN